MGSENVTSEITTYSMTLYYLHEILFVLFCIIGITLDVIIIYTIARFKKLQAPNNIYLANWAAVDIFSLIITPNAYMIVSTLDHISTDIGFFFGCMKIGVLLHSAVIVAMFIIVLDWSLAAYFPNVSEKFGGFTVFVLAMFWFVTGISAIISLAVCRTLSFCVVNAPVLLVCFGCLGLYVVILNIIRTVQKCRNSPLEYSTLSLNISTLFVATWTFGFFNIAHLRWSVEHPMLSLIMDCATFSSPIVNFVMLYKFNTGFKECLRQLFSRHPHSQDHYYQFTNPVVVNDYTVDAPKDQMVYA